MICRNDSTSPGSSPSRYRPAISARSSLVGGVMAMAISLRRRRPAVAAYSCALQPAAHRISARHPSPLAPPPPPHWLTAEPVQRVRKAEPQPALAQPLLQHRPSSTLLS